MIDIIAPVHNEAGNVKKLFDEIDKEINTEKRVSVVYDFDEDNTLPVVRKIMDKYSFPVRIIKNILGCGVLNAIITGFQEAEYDKVLVIMADLSDRLDVVDTMAARMGEGYDLVCGSRYMKGGNKTADLF